MDFVCPVERPICLRVNRKDRDRQCGQENNEPEYSPIERIKSILEILENKTGEAGEACPHEPREPKLIEPSDDEAKAKYEADKAKYEALKRRYKDCNCYGFDTAWLILMKDIENNFDEIKNVLLNKLEEPVKQNEEEGEKEEEEEEE